MQPRGLFPDSNPYKICGPCMETVCELVTKFSTFRTNAHGSHIIFFTPGKSTFQLFSVSFKDGVPFLSRCDLSIRTKSRNAIINAKLTKRKIYLFYGRHFEVYYLSDSRIFLTGVIPGVIGTYRTGDSVFYMRKSELVIQIQNGFPKLIPAKLVSIVRNKYLATQFNGTFYVFNKRKCVYERKTDKMISGVDIRKKKVYVLHDDKIEGYDLNIYLDSLTNLNIQSFFNIKNRLILFDKLKREMFIYEKNLDNLVYSCGADICEYITRTRQIYCIFNGKFVILQQINIYKEEFRLIDKSTVYCEKEDEFDCSDDCHYDIVE